MTKGPGAGCARLLDSDYRTTRGNHLNQDLLATAVALATVGSAAAQPAFAQFAQRTEPVDMDMVSRIRQEAFHHSQVMQTLAELTEDVGPRLTNSPNMDKANEIGRATCRESVCQYV